MARHGSSMWFVSVIQPFGAINDSVGLSPLISDSRCFLTFLADWKPCAEIYSPMRRDQYVWNNQRNCSLVDAMRCLVTERVRLMIHLMGVFGQLINSENWRLAPFIDEWWTMKSIRENLFPTFSRINMSQFCKSRVFHLVRLVRKIVYRCQKMWFGLLKFFTRSSDQIFSKPPLKCTKRYLVLRSLWHRWW